MSAPERTTLGNGEWFLMFNLETRKQSGGKCTVRCMLIGDLAYSFEEQFRWGDIVILTGEIDRYRAGGGYTGFQISNIVHVLSYAFITDFKGEIEPLSEEKTEFLQACCDLYDRNAPKPTAEEVVHYKQLRAERAKQNLDRKKKGA